MKRPSFTHVVIISILIRIILIFYSEWHDQHATVKYTDIDYRVFTDAARYLLHPTPVRDGESANIAQGPLGMMLGFGERVITMPPIYAFSDIHIAHTIAKPTAIPPY